MSFRPAEIVFVKTTGEQGFVLATQESDVPTFSQKVFLRLPRMNQQEGIQHDQKLWFYAEELESPQERTLREFTAQTFEYDLRAEWQEKKRVQLKKAKELSLEDLFSPQGEEGGGQIQ